MKQNFLPALLSALAVWSLCEGLQLPPASRYGLWMAALFALVWLLGRRWLSLSDGKLKAYTAVFGFGLAACLLLGQRMEQVGTVAGEGMIWLIIAMLCFTPAAGSLFAMGAQRMLQPHEAKAPRMSSRSFFWLSFGVILLGWTVIFLSLYPGVFAYDALNQLVQGVDAPYNKHHPLLHTLMMNFFIRWGQSIGNANLGIAANAVVQMILMSLSCAYSLKVIRREGCPKPVYITALAMFALLPFHGAMAVSTAKDPLFAAAVLWTVTLLFEGFRTRGWTWWMKMAVATALTCLSRNNGLYALIVMMALGVILCRKSGIRCLCAVLAGLVLYTGVNAGVDAILQPKVGKSREFLSVPIQQMARAAWNHPEWQQDADFKALFQGELEYEPLISDPAKEIFRTDGETPFSQVIRLWLRMFREYPAEYVDAFLIMSRGWWDINDLTHSTLYGGWAGYMQLNVFGGQGVERRPILPFMAGMYEDLLHFNGYQKLPVLNLLFAPAMWIWLNLFILMTAMYGKRRDVLLPALLLLGVTATILMGPCVLMRYAYPVMLSVPALAGMLASQNVTK